MLEICDLLGFQERRRECTKHKYFTTKLEEGRKVLKRLPLISHILYHHKQMDIFYLHCFKKELYICSLYASSLAIVYLVCKFYFFNATVGCMRSNNRSRVRGYIYILPHETEGIQMSTRCASVIWYGKLNAPQN